MRFLFVLWVGSVLAAWDVPSSVSEWCRGIIEDTKLDEYFVCGVSREHSGRLGCPIECVCILPDDD